MGRELYITSSGIYDGRTDPLGSDVSYIEIRADATVQYYKVIAGAPYYEGIYVSHALPTIKNCYIGCPSENPDGYVFGIEFYRAGGLIENCIIEVGAFGFAIQADGYDSLSIKGCNIISTVAPCALIQVFGGMVVDIDHSILDWVSPAWYAVMNVWASFHMSHCLVTHTPAEGEYWWCDQFWPDNSFDTIVGNPQWTSSEAWASKSLSSIFPNGYFLGTGSAARDAGDPDTTYAGTTSINLSADQKPRDIGFHYPFSLGYMNLTVTPLLFGPLRDLWIGGKS